MTLSEGLQCAELIATVGGIAALSKQLRSVRKALDGIRSSVDGLGLLVERSAKSAEKAANNSAGSKTAADIVGSYVRELRDRAAQIASGAEKRGKLPSYNDG